MERQTEDANLFAHPLAFALTHIVFPLFMAGSLWYIHWLVKSELDAAWGLKLLWAAGLSSAVPMLAAGRIAFGPKRLGLATQIAFALGLVAFAYFAWPVVMEVTRKVDSWMLSPTVLLAFWIGVVPPVFAGVARVATVPSGKFSFGEDLVLSATMTILGPVGIFTVFHVVERICMRGRHEAIGANALAIALVVCSLLLFAGLCRIAHLIGSRSFGANENLKRIALALIFGLALPWGGLALNQHIPFPADFANPWPWFLSAATTVAMLPPRVRANGWGLALWFLKFAVAPFVLYFFILFVPFLPLAVVAIVLLGAGFLVLAPTLLFRHFTADVYRSWRALREGYSKTKLIVLAALAFLLMPIGFAVDVEIERAGLQTLIKWIAEEDFDAPAAPLPVSRRRAERIVKNANDFACGVEIPFLSSWRTFRVYDGLYLADELRGELNLRVLGRKLDPGRDWARGGRDFFGALFFGGNASRGRNRGRGGFQSAPPLRTKSFTATCTAAGGGEYLLKVHAENESAKHDSWQVAEFVAPFRLPAGLWIEGMRLKMDDGTWKDARASERKAAEFVYRQITQRLRDPSIVTLDTPTEGTLKIFPVGKNGRDVEIRLRGPGAGPMDESIWLDGKEVPMPGTGNVSSTAGLVVAKAAPVSFVSAAWMAAHTNELVKAAVAESPIRLSLDAPTFKSDLRRRMRSLAKTVPASAPGVVPSFEFVRWVPARRVYRDGGHQLVPATNEVSRALTGKLVPSKFLWAVRREFPGVAAFGDRPLDGWYLMETESGGKVAVPCRRGEGALVFARLKGATVDEGKWSEGAKVWALENESFLKPALDVRRQLLEGTRRTGALTTQSAYIAVERTAQEQALRQKEQEALYGNRAFEFDEPETSDAPGLFLILGLFVAVAAVRRQWARGKEVK